MKYIAFDLETGGTKKECSPLSAYLVVLDEDLTTVLGEIELNMKPDGGAPYSVTAEALGVNKINLIEHDKTAITVTDASQRLYKFLDLHSDQGTTKLTPIGHNVYFDEMFIKEHLMAVHNWNKFVSYRHLDTGTVAMFLRMCGMIPYHVNGGLGALCDAMDVPFSEKDKHSAKGDTMATVKLLRKMRKMVQDAKNQSR